MWAVARYDFGLTDEEFGRLTPAQFWMLWERRSAAFQRQCFLHGVTASAVYNVQRTDTKQHLFSAMDFVPRSAQRHRQEELVGMLRAELNTLETTQHAQARATWMETLTRAGMSHPEEILSEVFEGLEN